MNKKIILTIIIAILLALVCALMFVNKDKTDFSYVENKVQEQQETKLSQEEIEQDEIVEHRIEERIEKPVVLLKEEIKSETKLEKIVADDNIVQEARIVEEIEDYGIIRNSDGIYEITREFKMKSPTKYSFVDFGVLEKVSK